MKVVVVLPAYNAAATLEKTYREIPHDLVDEIILVDDGGSDNTVELAASLGIRHIHRHPFNKGYGANQKTCYTLALASGADIIIMLHPDYQYTPKLIPAMAHIIASGLYPVVLGSRILGNGARRGGMPLIKYVANRVLTFFQNIFLGAKLSEYHTGYRAYHRSVLESIRFMDNSDDFIFDNEVLSQIIMKGFAIAEITCPTRYDPESSSISLSRSVVYGLGVLRVTIQHILHKWGIKTHRRYL
ncbi:MAG: glycosyltransferase family 2 protein [Flavobacteriales bacterium]|nr:glycosyltransferase family 2 protein [Flavobacteriales bacterium]MCX7767650.1 glycosyltransferase family 2 protein [Flavobacteriales bacterium]MDW8409508.1 glycosyltransferase family 2 protein [Flavobacteriales bacterium]